jgi:hypothetical protein
MQTEPSPPTARRARGPLPVLLALLLLALLASACSVANPFAPKQSSAQDQERAALQWAQCMRAHGVNVPDPGQSHGAGQIQVQGGDDKQMQDAMNACKRYEPNGGRANGSPDPKMVDAMARFTQCMRDHGIPMQDPTTSGGASQVIGGDQSSGPDPNSDQFKQAQQACQHYLNGVKGGVVTQGAGPAQGAGTR